MVKIKLHYPPVPPRKPIPFSKGLEKIPRRYHGWLALTCLLAGVFYILFGLYVHWRKPPPPFHPLLVSPRQVAWWIEQERSLRLVELWDDDQAPEPLLKDALRLKPLSASSQEEREREIRRFGASLPAPAPWLICYSLGPETEKEVSLFIELLTRQGIEHVYALSGSPAKWEDAGLVRTEP